MKESFPLNNEGINEKGIEKSRNFFWKLVSPTTIALNASAATAFTMSALANFQSSGYILNAQTKTQFIAGAGLAIATIFNIAYNAHKQK